MMKKILSVIVVMALCCGLLTACEKKLDPIEIENEKFQITIEEFVDRYNEVNDKKINVDDFELLDFGDVTYSLKIDGKEDYSVLIGMSDDGKSIKIISMFMAIDRGDELLQDYPDKCFPYVYAFCGDKDKAQKIFDDLDILGATESDEVEVDGAYYNLTVRTEYDKNLFIRGF